MHIHAQTTVERDRKAVLVLRGSDQHVAITTSITTSSPREHTRFCEPGRMLDCENPKCCGPGRRLDRENPRCCGPGRRLCIVKTRGVVVLDVGLIVKTLGFSGSGRRASFDPGHLVTSRGADKFLNRYLWEFPICLT